MLTMCPIKFFKIIIFNAKITVSLIIFNLPAVTQTGLHWKKSSFKYEKYILIGKNI